MVLVHKVKHVAESTPQTLRPKLPFLKNVFSSFFNVCGFQVRARFFSASVIFKAAQKSCSKQRQKTCYFLRQNIKAVSFGLNIFPIFIGCLFSFQTAVLLKYISAQGRKPSSLFLFSVLKNQKINSK